MLAVVIFLILLLVGVYILLQLFKDRNMDMPMAYAEVKSQEMKSDPDSGKTELFAQSLCVGENSIAAEGIQIPEREKAALFDLDRGEVIFSQNMYEKAYPASITKIVTAILALKYGNMEDEITITEADLNLEDGSQMSGIQAGDKTTMEELFHVLMIYSGNDAAMAIARHVGGSVEQFVEMMNEEAKNLGATGTHFANPSGLHDENHYTTAYDIYLFLQEALQYEKFVDTMQNGSYTFTYYKADGTKVQKYLDSTDKYLTGEKTPPKNVTVLGGKTGTTSKAGSCLAVLCQNAYGEPYISVVLNAQNKTSLYRDMNLLLQQTNS